MPFTIGGEWIADKNKSNLAKNSNSPVQVVKERRGNSTVTAVLNLSLTEIEIKKLCSYLKQVLACGGTIKGKKIELQGDKVEQVKKIIKDYFKNLKRF